MNALTLFHRQKSKEIHKFLIILIKLKQFIHFQSELHNFFTFDSGKKSIFFIFSSWIAIFLSLLRNQASQLICEKKNNQYFLNELYLKTNKMQKNHRKNILNFLKIIFFYQNYKNLSMYEVKIQYYVHFECASIVVVHTRCSLCKIHRAKSKGKNGL